MGRYIYLLVISMTVVGVFSLSCNKCVKDDCKPAKDCKYGEGLDICGCCPECLKGPEDECRGIWNHAGDCGTGLVCSKENYPVQKNADGSSDQSPGVCKPAVETNKTAEVETNKTEEVKTNQTLEVKPTQPEEVKTNQTLEVKPSQP